MADDDTSVDERSVKRNNMVVDKRVLLNITDICNKIKLKNDGGSVIPKFNSSMPAFNYKNDIEELSFITHDSDKEEKSPSPLPLPLLGTSKIDDDFEIKSNASTKSHSSKTKDLFKFPNSPVPEYHQSNKSNHYSDKEDREHESEKKRYSDNEEDDRYHKSERRNDDYYRSERNPIDNINGNGSAIVAKPKSYLELKQQLEYKINLFTQWERLFNVYGGTHTQQLNFETTTIEEIEFELIKLKTKRSQGTFAATAKQIISATAFGIESGLKSFDINRLDGWSANINHNLDQFDDAIDDLNIMFAGSGKSIHPIIRISGLMTISAVMFAISQTFVSKFTNQMFTAMGNGNGGGAANNNGGNGGGVNVGGFKDFGPPDLDDELNELLMNKQDMRNK